MRAVTRLGNGMRTGRRLAAATMTLGLVAGGVVATSAAAATPDTLYAYATAATTGLAACPNTAVAANQCSLAEALGLAQAGDTIDLATPGSAAAAFTKRS